MAMVSAVLSLLLSASTRLRSRPPVVSTPTRRRVAPALVAVLALAALVALTACGGGGGGEEETAATTPAGETPTQAPTVERPTPTPEGPTPTAAASPTALATLCLVTPEEADEALGEFVTGIPEVTGVAEPYCEYLTESGIYLRIEPGAPEDFQAGAQLDGVEGEPVPGTGDEAAWFYGVQGSARFPTEPTPTVTQGVLSVRQGVVYLRIILNLPEVDSSTQLEIAKGLAAKATERLP